MLKSESRFWLAVLAVILLGSFGACTWIAGFFSTQRDFTVHHVRIGRATDSLIYSLDPVTAFPLDFIEWSHSLSETVIVELQGVPVTPQRQVLPEGVTERVMVWDSAASGTYKYVVKVVRALGDTLVFDPHIDVRPKR